MKVFNRSIKLGGSTRVVNAISVRVLVYDQNGKILVASGTSVPTGAGYAKGALFIKTDAVTGTKALYENQGLTTSASFNVIGDITTAEIADGGVTLAKLATGITPSHIIVAAGEFTTAGGDANESATITGVLATDKVVASIKDNGTNNVTLLQSATGSGKVDFTMSADPGTDCIISYMVIRAAA